MRREPLQKLDFIEVKHREDAPVVVMLHGYGASSQDLVAFSNEVKPGFDVNWYFPNAPLEIIFTPFFKGRAWFPISFEELQAKGGNYSHIRPEGLEESRILVENFLNRLSIPLNRVILAGFSQGAMVALEVALQLQEQLAAVALFSTTLVDVNKVALLAKFKAGLPFFQTHGLYDDLLSVDSAKELFQLLNNAGLKGALHLFEDGHTIPEESIILFEKFLKEHLTKS